jgi:hypothetical protein
MSRPTGTLARESTGINSPIQAADGTMEDIRVGDTLVCWLLIIDLPPSLRNRGCGQT